MFAYVCHRLASNSLCFSLHCKLIPVADILDKLFVHIGLEPVVKISYKKSFAKKTRRLFRGNLNRVSIDRTLAFSWVDSFQTKLYSQFEPACQKLYSMCASPALKFGYKIWSTVYYKVFKSDRASYEVHRASTIRTPCSPRS